MAQRKHKPMLAWVSHTVKPLGVGVYINLDPHRFSRRRLPISLFSMPYAPSQVFFSQVQVASTGSDCANSNVDSGKVQLDK